MKQEEAKKASSVKAGTRRSTRDNKVSKAKARRSVRRLQGLDDNEIPLMKDSKPDAKPSVEAPKDLDNMRVPQLKALALSMDLPMGGGRRNLIKRIRKAQKN